MQKIFQSFGYPDVCTILVRSFELGGGGEQNYILYEISTSFAT